MKESLKKIATEMEKASFLNFIDQEISALASSKKDGYTPWILVAAGAVLISYLLSALEFGGHPTWHNIGTLFLFLLFLYDAVDLLWYFIKTPSKTLAQQNNRFYIPLYQGFPTRTKSLFLFIKCSLLLAVLHALAFDSGFSFFAALYLYLMATILLVMFLFSFFPKNKAKKNENRSLKTDLIVLLFLTPFVVAFFWLCLEVLLIWHDLTFTDFKVAFSFSAILIVLYFLVEAFSRPSSSAEDLKNIKRSLVLDLITISNAKQQADKILFGYTAEDFDAQQLKDMQNNINSLNELVTIFEKSIGNMKESSSYNITETLKIMEDVVSTINYTNKNTPGILKRLFWGDIERNTYKQQIKEKLSLSIKTISLIKEVGHLQVNTIEKLQNEIEEKSKKAGLLDTKINIKSEEVEENNKKAALLEAKINKLLEKIESSKQTVTNQERETL